MTYYATRSDFYRSKFPYPPAPVRHESYSWKVYALVIVGIGALILSTV